MAPVVPQNSSSLLDVLKRTALDPILGAVGARPQDRQNAVNATGGQTGNTFLDWLLEAGPFTRQAAQTGVAPPTQPVPTPPSNSVAIGAGLSAPYVSSTTTPAVPAPTPAPSAVTPSGTYFAGTSPAGSGAASPPASKSTAPGSAQQPTPLAKALSELSAVKAPGQPEAPRAGSPSLPTPKNIDLSPVLSLMTQLGQSQGARQTQLPFLTNFLGTAPQR